jgi:hypothetical protein
MLSVSPGSFPPYRRNKYHAAAVVATSGPLSADISASSNSVLLIGADIQPVDILSSVPISARSILLPLPARLTAGASNTKCPAML